MREIDRNMRGDHVDRDRVIFPRDSPVSARTCTLQEQQFAIPTNTERWIRGDREREVYFISFKVL